MKKVILTVLLSLCAATALSGCHGGGSDMNKTGQNANPAPITRDEEPVGDNTDCPDGNCPDNGQDGDCPENGDRPPFFPHGPKSDRGRFRHNPRPLPCPAKDD